MYSTNKFVCINHVDEIVRTIANPFNKTDVHNYTMPCCPRNFSHTAKFYDNYNTFMKI